MASFHWKSSSWMVESQSLGIFLWFFFFESPSQGWMEVVPRTPHPAWQGWYPEGLGYQTHINRMVTHKCHIKKHIKTSHIIILQYIAIHCCIPCQYRIVSQNLSTIINPYQIERRSDVSDVAPGTVASARTARSTNARCTGAICSWRFPGHGACNDGRFFSADGDQMTRVSNTYSLPDSPRTVL